MAQHKENSNGSNRGLKIALVILIILCLAGAGLLIYQNFLAPREDAGATVTSYDGMTDEEIQAELDRQTEESRMTISVAAHPELADGRVRVNLVNDQDNRFDQKLTLTQDGKTLFESGVVKAGKTLEWVDAADAHAGTATVTVSAVDPDSGEVTGNPQSVEVEITAAE